MSRKRPRTSSPGDDSTDYKLALLSSLHPSCTPSALLDLLLSCNGSVTAVTALLTSPPRTRSTSTQSSLSSFIPITSTPRPPKKGATLTLYNPTHISSLTPTSLYTSFFPPSTANALLRELLVEAESFPPPQKFELFDRAVVSPHTSCFFLRDRGDAGLYSYQGAAVPETRVFTRSMGEATELVERSVNEMLRGRARGWGEMKEEWRVNAALVNCYRGGGQCVGWHTDQLTYLGPRAVIASVSLGCTREFRMKRIVRGRGGSENEDEDEDEKEKVKEKDIAETEGTYVLPLPHNSLLLMHPGMQESWKHSIHPTTTSTNHPISSNIRINITYRCYRDSLRPEFTPRCKCGEPAILRAAGARSYYWVCAQEYVLGKVRCPFWKEARFDEYGEPVWGGEDQAEGNGAETPPGRGGAAGINVTPSSPTVQPQHPEASSPSTKTPSLGCLQEVDEDVASLFREG